MSMMGRHRAAGHSLQVIYLNNLEKIWQGKLQPGENPRAEICNLYGLSRTPVREVYIN